VVTALGPERWKTRELYEGLYCARGEMENRIKEQLMLFADRTSTALLRSNQIRLYFSSIAYTLMEALRRLGLQQTELGRAQRPTIRLRMLKVSCHENIHLWFSEEALKWSAFLRQTAKTENSANGMKMQSKGGLSHGFVSTVRLVLFLLIAPTSCENRDGATERASRCATPAFGRRSAPPPPQHTTPADREPTRRCPQNGRPPRQNPALARNSEI